MRYEHAWYLTKDKSLNVEFLFLNLGEQSGWRAYILSGVDYKTRSDSCLITHRLYEGRNERYIDESVAYPYICWSQTVHDLETLKNIAAVWSEITAYYILHGGEFEKIQARLAAEGVI